MRFFLSFDVDCWMKFVQPCSPIRHFRLIVCVSVRKMGFSTLRMPNWISFCVWIQQVNLCAVSGQVFPRHACARLWVMCPSGWPSAVREMETLLNTFSVLRPNSVRISNCLCATKQPLGHSVYFDSDMNVRLCWISSFRRLISAWCGDNSSLNIYKVRSGYVIV
jgi:hypothetical protein